MSKSNSLPSVLIAPNPADSLSMERALKQIQFLLFEISTEEPFPEEHADMLAASCDAIETMLNAIDRD